MNLQNTLTHEVSFDLLKQYYKAMHMAYDFANYDLLEDFRKSFPKEFSFLNKVHKRRTDVNLSIKVMQDFLAKPLYFGTLTFNKGKDKNKVASKRKEAFIKLNKLFECFLLVEEYGEKSGRYHLHFIGVFKEGFGFDNFKRFWHSRQNLEKVDDPKRAGQYLVKYVCKEVPRLRRNKNLIRLENAYKKGKRLQKNFPSLGIATQVGSLLAINNFGDL